MRFPPWDVIAKWPMPNYVNPETQGPTLMIVEFIFLPLTVIIVALRLYIRAFMIKRLWWDDWLMVAATLCATGVTTCVVLATQRYGWDVHIWDLPLQLIKPSRQVSIAGQTIFLLASGLTKLSILGSYLRIAVSKTFFRAIHVSIAIIVVWVIVFAIVLWTQCVPISEYWTLSFVTNRNCIAEGPPLMGQTTLTIITDILVYVLPIPVLWNLQLPTKQRIGLLILFTLGLFVIIAGIMRTFYTHYVVYETYDVTWEGYNLWIWTALECDLGIIGGSIPALKPLIFSATSKIVSVSRNRSTRNSTGFRGGQLSRGTAVAPLNNRPSASVSTKTLEGEAPIILSDWSDSGDQTKRVSTASLSAASSSTPNQSQTRFSWGFYEAQKEAEEEEKLAPSRRGSMRPLSQPANAWIPPSNWNLPEGTDLEAQRQMVKGRPGPLPLLDEP